MSSRSLGRLTLDLVARVGGFEQGMDRAERRTRRASQQMSRDLEVARRAVGGLIGAMSVGAVARFAQSQLQAADAINTAAQVANISTDSIQELRYAFGQLANVADREVDAALRRFNRRLGLARQEAGPAKAAFEEMFGSANRFRDTEQALDAVISSLAAMEDQSERAARASAFFGDDAGPALAAALGQGEAAVEAMRKELREMGGVLDAEVIEKASEATNELARTGRELRARLIPLVSVAAEGALFLADNMDAIATVAGVLGGVLATRLTASLITTSAQMAIGAVQNAAYQASLARMAGQARATGVALAGLRGAMAVLGGPAGIAVAAAGALGVWAMSALQGRDDTESLREEVDRLTMSMDELQAKQLDKSLERANSQLEEQQRILERQRKQLENLEGAWRPDPSVLLIAEEAIKETEGKIEEITEFVDRLQQQRDRLAQPIDTPGVDTSGGGGAENEALEEYLGKLREQQAQLEINTALEQARYDIASGALGELDDTQKALVESLAEELDLKRELIEADQERARELEQLREQIEQSAEASRLADMDAIERERERYRLQMENLQSLLGEQDEWYELRELAEEEHQRRMAAIQDEAEEEQRRKREAAINAAMTHAQQSLQITTNALQQAGQEGSRAYQLLFAIQQAAAIPSMIMATESAATKALDALPGFAGIALSGAVRAMGYSSIGIVAGQSIASAAGYADGGAVSGPGGPRDDKILAWLSNGEHVLTAEDVRNLGGHSAVERIREQAKSAPAFASGGPVGLPGPSVGAGKIRVIVNNNGEPVEAQSRTEQNGDEISIIVDLWSAAADAGRLDNAMQRNFGAQRPGRRR